MNSLQDKINLLDNKYKKIIEKMIDSLLGDVDTDDELNESLYNLICHRVDDLDDGKIYHAESFMDHLINESNFDRDKAHEINDRLTDIMDDILDDKFNEEDFLRILVDFDKTFCFFRELNYLDFILVEAIEKLNIIRLLLDSEKDKKTIENIDFILHYYPGFHFYSGPYNTKSVGLLKDEAIEECENKKRGVAWAEYIIHNGAKAKSYEEWLSEYNKKKDS